MPDSNPTLTASLLGTRDTLMNERSDILNRMRELNTMLEMNSTQIEAADTLMLRFNPDHISLDVRSDLEGAPLVVQHRTPLQLASTVSDSALAQAAAPAEVSARQSPAAAEAPTPAKSGSKRGRKPGKTADVKTAKKTRARASAGKTSPDAIAEEAAAVDAVVAAKPERSPAYRAMVDYFKKSDRNETILKILESMQEPVSANTVASHYKALYPLPGDSAEIRNIFNGRVSSALHYLKARGQATRVADEKPGSRQGSNVLWELSKSHRAQARKGRLSAGRKARMNGHPVLPAAADNAQLSGTTH